MEEKHYTNPYSDGGREPEDMVEEDENCDNVDDSTQNNNQKPN